MNKNRLQLAETAKQQQTPFWNRMAAEVANAARRRRVVNLSRLSRVTQAGEVVVVPGKLLGDGDLTHKLTVAAVSFSSAAKEKLAAAGCTTFTLSEFMDKKPAGKWRIIG